MADAEVSRPDRYCEDLERLTRDAEACSKGSAYIRSRDGAGGLRP